MKPGWGSIRHWKLLLAWTLKIAVLVAWTAASLYFAYFVGGVIYLSGGIALDQIGDMIIAMVVVIIFIGWLQATWLLLRALKLRHRKQTV